MDTWHCTQAHTDMCMEVIERDLQQVSYPTWGAQSIHEPRLDATQYACCQEVLVASLVGTNECNCPTHPAIHIKRKAWLQCSALLGAHCIKNAFAARHLNEITCASQHTRPFGAGEQTSTEMVTSPGPPP